MSATVRAGLSADLPGIFFFESSRGKNGRVESFQGNMTERLEVRLDTVRQRRRVAILQEDANCEKAEGGTVALALVSPKPHQTKP
jgi:hypothetical protein